jgi:glyoxylate reductase
MKILYSDNDPRPEFQEQVGGQKRDLASLLGESDVVSVHVPSTPETRGMFGEERFSQMKPGALFINTARGDLVDETALLSVLDQGRLGGAGLDVFSREPNVPRELVVHPKVVALPHIGSATTETRRAMASLAVENAMEVLAGREPITPVAF